MEMKKVEKAIDITASKANVWRVLIEDEFTRQWFAEFMPGTHATTDWKEGSTVTYTDADDNGMIGKIASNKPQEELIVELTGEILKGKEEYESASAKAVQGGKEIYRLSDNHGRTHLAVETGMPADYYETMTLAWDRALEKVRMLSEMLEVQ